MVISGIHREQHFVKAFSACPAYIIADYGINHKYYKFTGEDKRSKNKG
jgi:hypothetical protein